MLKVRSQSFIKSAPREFVTDKHQWESYAISSNKRYDFIN
jgi:hypothetical protein